MFAMKKKGGNEVPVYLVWNIIAKINQKHTQWTEWMLLSEISELNWGII